MGVTISHATAAVSILPEAVHLFTSLNKSLLVYNYDEVFYKGTLKGKY